MAGARFGGGNGENRAQVGDPVTAMRRDRQHVDPGESGAVEQRVDLRRDNSAALGPDLVGFGEHGDAAVDAEQVEDGKVLARLRHDPVVGGDHQHHKIDAASARQHRAHQLFVARHVDEAERVAVRVALVGEAEVDSDAALLLPRASDRRRHQSAP